MKRVAMLLSCDSFEKFFGGMFNLDRDSYVQTYRNDFAWSYGEALVQKGHQVFLYVLSYGPAELRLAPGGLQVRFLPLPAWLRAADPVLFRLQQLPGGEMRRDRVAYLGYRRALSTAMAMDAIDLLYVQEVWTPRFLLVLRDAGLPVIGADHGARYDPALNPLRRAVFPHATKLICQTTDNLQNVQALGGNGLLIPNGIDTNFFSPDPAGHNGDRPKTILAVGRLTETQKRFSDLIRALVLLPDFHLNIVGSGPDGALLEGLAQELGVRDRVNFLGFVSDRSTLRQLYREASLFVSSSAWEAVALVVLEAMSCGTPVVATRIPSFEVLLDNAKGGLLVPVGKPDHLAAAIQDVYRDRVALGLAARARVEASYAADTLYEQLSQTIENC